MDQDNDLKIEELGSELEQLKARVADLEKELGELKQIRYIEPQPAAPAPAQPFIIKPSPKPAARSEKSPNGEGWETVIGGKLLNRVGIIVLLLAAAYFLKYSIDNGWIGIVGRIVIGFIAGVVFLGAGDVMMRKGYNYFSQGMSGGGIGIIYLTTFFAVGQYHLIGRMPGFALLILTALAGGMLAVRQNAYGVGLLSTLGGFLAPFMIGSQSPNTVGLLGYITVLDLAVLYLARHKNWRSLNHISFWGTMIVYMINYSAHFSAPGESMWIYQLFAAVFFVIFGALSFYYNVLHRQATKAWDVLLLVLNAAFFFGFTCANLEYDYHAWLGLAAIVLAAFYLLVAMGLRRKGLGDDLLFLALLGTGLAFVTVAIPLQLSEDWIAAAWLVESVVLIFAGIRGSNAWVRWAGVVLLVLVSLIFGLNYPLDLHKQTPLLSIFSFTCVLSIAGLYLTAYLFRTAAEVKETEKFIVWPAVGLATLMLLKQLAWEVANAISYYGWLVSEKFAVSISWVVAAVIMMIVGMARDIKGIRYIALGLFGVTTAKVLLYDLSGLAVIYRVLILVIVGAILVGVSFMYQNLNKGEDSQ